MKESTQTRTPGSVKGFLLNITKPEIRLLIITLLVLTLPFERIPSLDLLLGSSSVTLRLSQFFGLGLIASTVIYYFLKKEVPSPRRSFDVLLILFLFSYLVSVVFARDQGRSILVYMFTAFVSLVAIAISFAQRRLDLDKIEKFLLLGTALALVFGLYQYLGDVLGLSTALTGLKSIYVKEVFGFPRIQSVGLEPLYFGNFLLIPYTVILAKQITGKKLPVWQWAIFFFIVVELVLTVSRGAIYAGIIATVFLWIIFIFNKKAKAPLVALSAFIILAGILTSLFLTWAPSQINKPKVDKYTGAKKTQKLIQQAGNFDSQDDRVRNRALAAKAFKTAPIFGIGPGNFSDFAIKAYPPYKTSAPVIVNNEPLELLAESGIVGTSLLLAFFGSLLIFAGRLFIKGQAIFEGPNGYWLGALCGYIVALAVQYQTFSTLYILHIWVAIGILMAIVRGSIKKGII